MSASAVCDWIVIIVGGMAWADLAIWSVQRQRRKSRSLTEGGKG